MASRKKTPERKPGKTASLKQIYARMRKEFTAADLQKYTEIEEGIPLEKVVAEMEEIYWKFENKRK